MKMLLAALAVMGMLPHGHAADRPPRPLVHMPAKGPAGTGVDGLSRDREADKTVRRTVLSGQRRELGRAAGGPGNPDGKDIVASATKAKDKNQR